MIYLFILLVKPFILLYKKPNNAKSFISLLLNIKS